MTVGSPETMKAWVVSQPGPIETSPLRYVEKPVPVPAPGELLCAGIIGYRALLRASLPARGGLGLYGFGDSAHLVAQVALAQGATVHALTRGEASQRLALELGAASAGARMIPRRSPWTARSCSRQSRSSCSRAGGCFQVHGDIGLAVRVEIQRVSSFLVLVRQDRKATERGKRAV